MTTNLWEQFNQIEPAQRTAIVAIWGINASRGRETKDLYTAWSSRFHKPIAVRFIWQALSPVEQLLLFHVLTSSEQTGIECETLAASTNIDRNVITQALAHLESLLLITKQEGEETSAIGQYREYGDTLLQVGKEIFDGAERFHLTLTQQLTQLSVSSRSLFVFHYAMMVPDIPNMSWPDTCLRELAQRGRAFAVLKTLNWHLRYLVAMAYEHGGKITFAEADARLNLSHPIWYDILILAEELYLLFDTLDPSGQRVLFLPKDLYEISKVEGLAPCTCQQLHDAICPAWIREGNPLWLYNLIALVGMIFQQDIEASTFHEQFAHQPPQSLLSMLQGLPRPNAAGGDLRVEMVSNLARSLDLVTKVQVLMGGPKVYYRRGIGMNEWLHSDRVTQTRQVLRVWLRSLHWVDLMAATNGKEWDLPSWKREERSTYAREALVSYLRGLAPGRWYPVSSLQSSLYTYYADLLRSPYYSFHASRATPSGVLYREWQQREGAYFVGMLASSAYELGLVSLGYRQDPGDSVASHLCPDLFRITDLGYLVLQSEETDNKQELHSPPMDIALAENGEIVLTAADRDTYHLLLFSSIQQTGQTNRLKMTRSSLLRGLEHGLCLDQIVEILTHLSQKDLPPEVVSSLRNWSCGFSHEPLLTPRCQPPTLVDEGEPAFLFDLAIVVGTLYHESIETTDRGTLPKRLIKKLHPLFHGRARPNVEESDEYLQLLLKVATYHGLLTKSRPRSGGNKEVYERGYRLEEWQTSPLPTQLHRILEDWTNSHIDYWQDIPSPPLVLWGKTDWNPVAARTLLLNYLSFCLPHQWYSINTLLEAIWKQDIYALRPSRLEQIGNEPSRRRSLTRSHWDLCEAALYRGILVSSLYPFGLVSLGTTSENRQGSHEGQLFDSFRVTQIGAIALARWHGRIPPPSPHVTTRSSVVVQPTFTVLLLDPNNIEALYRLLPFTHIEQIGQVSKLTLTQASVHDALTRGGSHEKILTTLRELASKELPQNVVYTLSKWS